MKKRVALVAALMLLVTLVPNLNASVFSARELRLASVVTPQHHRHQGPLTYFANRVEELTKGSLKVRILHSSLLGGEREYIESVRNGSLEMATVSTGPVTGFVKEFDLFNLPFLFKDDDHFWKVVNGSIGKDLLKKLEPIGIKGLAFHDDGVRNVFNSKRAVKTPQDMKGLKIRVQESQVFISTINAMGASAVPMSYAEVYTALEQGVIDGAENTLNNYLTDRFWEKAKYLSLTGHLRPPNMMIINNKLFKSLTIAEQNAILKAAAESTEINRRTLDEAQSKSLEQLKANGVIVTEADRDTFFKACQPVYDKFEAVIGKDLIRKALSLAE